jgi:hypothetical protein
MNRVFRLAIGIIQAALKKVDVDPTVVLETDPLQTADHPKSKRPMQRHRCFVPDVGDQRDELTETRPPRLVDKMLEKRAAPACASKGRVEVDRDFSGVAVRRPLLPGRDERVTNYPAVFAGHQHWIPSILRRAQAALPVADRRCFEIERHDCVGDVMPVDLGDASGIGFLGRSDSHVFLQGRHGTSP